jgi:DNA-binding NarL/FixJ family response regulator
VIVVDDHLAVRRGIELLLREAGFRIARVELLREDPASPIVLYTGYTGADSMLHEAVRAGARGFVLKTSPAPRVTDALHVFEFQLAPGLSHVMMDRTGLEQIMMNLMIIASDAMPSGARSE